jgi:hypothetical protein
MIFLLRQHKGEILFISAYQVAGITDKPSLKENFK